AYLPGCAARCPRSPRFPRLRRPDPFDDRAWLFDLKLDGFRALAYIERGGARLVSHTPGSSDDVHPEPAARPTGAPLPSSPHRDGRMKGSGRFERLSPGNVP